MTKRTRVCKNTELPCGRTEGKFVRGYCKRCYSRVKRGVPLGQKPQRRGTPAPTCKNTELPCKREGGYGHGYCQRCWLRKRRGVPMDLPERRVARAPLEDNLVRVSSGCLLWNAALSRENGYGVVRDGGRSRGVHVVIWERANGPVPEGLFVCHTCDVRRCAELSHLWLGTSADNTADMVAKGRQSRGESHPGAKLTESDVRAIRADTRLQRVIALDYGVSRSVVSGIKRGTTWKWLV